MELNLRVKNERYEIYDVNFSDGVCSVTFLNPGQETRGHSHPQGELYIFCAGAGIMEVDSVRKEVRWKTVVSVQPNQFHKVINPGKGYLVFTCIWEDGI